MESTAHCDAEEEEGGFHHTILNLIGKSTLSGKVGYSLWLNGLQAKPFCLFLEGERALSEGQS